MIQGMRGENWVAGGKGHAEKDSEFLWGVRVERLLGRQPQSPVHRKRAGLEKQGQQSPARGLSSKSWKMAQFPWGASVLKREETKSSSFGIVRKKRKPQRSIIKGVRRPRVVGSSRINEAFWKGAQG